MDFENVIEHARQGEKKALECLYNTYYRKMKGVCAAILKEDKEEYEIPLKITQPEITTDELCGSMPSILAISLWLNPSTTDNLKTLR